MTTGNGVNKNRAIACAGTLLIACAAGIAPVAAAPKDAAPPAGTMLIPMAPKLDTRSSRTEPLSPAGGPGYRTDRLNVGPSAASESPAPASAPSAKPVQTQTQQARTAAQPVKTAAAPPKAQQPAAKTAAAQKNSTAITAKETSATKPEEEETPLASENLPPGQTKVSKPELPVPLPEPTIEGRAEADEEITDNTTLKGTVSITADDTEYDQDKNTFLGSGNAVATIAGQNSRLEADLILYDQNTQTMDARGNVKILRDGTLSTGSSFKFKVNSDEYLITDPDTEVQGTTVVARQGLGTKAGITFKNGTLKMPQPIYMARNPYVGTIQSAEDSGHKMMHPDAYMPAHPSFKFTARKMVYEKYKESGNLTVFGGKLKFGNFNVPLGKLTATVGENQSAVTFPVTPLIGNNLQVGGINVGPQFNYALGKGRTFSWAPTIQSGGRQPNGDPDKGKLGVGTKISYTGLRSSANLAYGSVSNLLVGDVKYRINNTTQFQGGVNRFLPDGLFGSRRARLLAEVVNQRGIGGIPFLTGVSFRSSAGWASDNPSLVNLTPDYAKLFTQTHGNIINGFRLEEQIMTQSEPIFSVGDKKYGAQLLVFGGAAARAYSSGDHMLMAQAGPIFNVNLNRARLQGTLFKSGVNGKSPFVFDQFIQGTKAAQIGGDIKICKWLTVGTNLGYNLDAKLLYQRSLNAAIGPEDFKLLISRDTIRGVNRFGFDVLYGQPIPFNKLVLKGSPDQGQQGGI